MLDILNRVWILLKILNIDWKLWTDSEHWLNITEHSENFEQILNFDWKGGYIAITLSVRSNFRKRYLSFYWKKWFYIWYMALTWWLVPCLPFPGLPHIYFLFTVRLRIFHVCHNENFRNSYLSFYWKKWFYIWYMALAWWLVPCLPFQGLLHIYFLFTVRLRIFHVCRNENFRNSYLSFYWKKWFYIWYMALAWWLVPCLPFPGLPHIYFLFTVRLRIFHVCRNENFRNS